MVRVAVLPLFNRQAMDSLITLISSYFPRITASLAKLIICVMKLLQNCN